MSPLVPSEVIQRKILLVRGHKVLLDSDLAALYGVPTHRLNEAVRRNFKRFPADFLIVLTLDEWSDLISQFAISSGRHGGRRKPPLAFTEQGVAMLSSVLSSERAVQVNIDIMRAFVQLRRMMTSSAALSRRLDELEKRYDGQFRAVFDAIRELVAPPVRPRRKIGF